MSGSFEMQRHLLVINGHPEPSPQRFGNALSNAFCSGAREAGWTVHCFEAATGCFRSEEMTSSIPVETAAGLMHAADRLAIVYPLWFDAPPAPVRALLDAAAKLRPQAAFPLRPRMAQLIVTMELPAFLHRSMLKGQMGNGSTEVTRGVFSTQVTFIGSVSALTDAQRRQWLHEVRNLGAGESSKILSFSRRSAPAVLRAA